jgi:hypothetical protein
LNGSLRHTEAAAHGDAAENTDFIDGQARTIALRHGRRRVEPLQVA